jgi:hypothetical protein
MYHIIRHKARQTNLPKVAGFHRNGEIMLDRPAQLSCADCTWCNPLALFFPLLIPLAPFSIPFTYLETLLAVTGSCPLWSQVADKLSPNRYLR